MKIPKKVKVKTKTITVEFDKELLRDDSRYGCYYGGKQKIYIDPTIPKNRRNSHFFMNLFMQ